MGTREPLKPTHQDYFSAGFIPLLCKEYHPKRNPRRDYKTAKEPVFSGWNNPDYTPPGSGEIAEWEKAGGWIGWRLPFGIIVLDVEDRDETEYIKAICREKGIEPARHISNFGCHYVFRTDKVLSAASAVFTRSGAKVTYRVGGKNYLILAPSNGRTWEKWTPLKDLPELPEEFLPYDRKSPLDVLNCLSWSLRRAYREGKLAGYEDVDAAFMGSLLCCKLEENQIHRAFQVVFGAEYDGRQTGKMLQRTRSRMRDGAPVLGAGTFRQRVREQGLNEVERFARELESTLGRNRVALEEEWPDPVPFDDFSSLPDFPVDALPGIGEEMVERISEVNQVDAALPTCHYLGVISTCLQRKAIVDLISHKEPLNIYLSPIYDSGNRKSSTDAVMTKPLYEYQRTRQEEMAETIRVASSDFKVKEKRHEALIKRAAGEDDPEERKRLEIEAREVARDMAENPLPTKPVYVVDDVTPEKIGRANGRKRRTYGEHSAGGRVV